PGLSPSVCSRMLNMQPCNSSVLVISRHTASIGPRMKILNTAFSVSAMAFPLSLCVLLPTVFDPVFELGELARPQRAVFRGPPVVDDLDGHDVKKQPPLAPDLFRMNQLRPFEHA